MVDFDIIQGHGYHAYVDEQQESSVSGNIQVNYFTKFNFLTVYLGLVYSYSCVHNRY